MTKQMVEMPNSQFFFIVRSDNHYQTQKQHFQTKGLKTPTTSFNNKYFNYIVLLNCYQLGNVC